MKTLGIDLGTTNSVVYTIERGIPVVVDIFGFKVTPSVVSWLPGTNEMVIGDNAKRRAMIHPETTIVSNKKNMGKKDFFYDIMDHKHSPSDVASYLLKYLVKGASESLGEQITKVVITVPAYFNINQREDTKIAAEKAGLELIMLQSEPTAAAIAYGIDQEKDQTIVVYDLGGGTFDISVMEVKGNDFINIAIGGDTDLGGDDFDNAIMDYCLKQIQKKYGVELKNDESAEAKAAKQKLKELAEDSKIELGVAQSTTIYLPNFLNQYNLEIDLNRDQYKELISPYLDKTVKILRSTLSDAKLASADINRVICVGGSTKSPLVLDILEKEIKRPYMADNVDEIVAKGAALTADSLTKPTDRPNGLPTRLVIKNIIPQNFGIRLAKDKFGILIPKNTPYPCEFEKEFTTFTDNATETDIEVFQGLEKKCNNNTPIGGFTLKGIKRAKAGEPRINVKFNLDKSSILRIEASDNSTGAGGSLVIEKFKPQPYNPSDQSKKSLENLRIGVSRVGYDDVGAILTKINIPWTKIEDKDFSNLNKLKRFDVVFINCLSGGNATKNKNALEGFVKDGGILYASDCAKDHLENAFPDHLDFCGNEYSGKVNCQIQNPELSDLLRSTKMKIKFNSVIYRAKSDLEQDVQIYLTADNNPITVGFPYKNGFVVFTAFHNYGTASKEEQEFLKFLILKPLAIATKTPLIELVNQLNS